MCGIAGIIHLEKERVDTRLLLKMAETLSHRGPDDEQFILFDPENSEKKLFRRQAVPAQNGRVGFAHRRLSIIDLTAEAAQPMSDEKEQLWIIHNGEIFNYLEIRKELEKKGYRFRTHSDTEVILKSYQEWGEDCLSRFNGMWAFVIYDLRTNTIFGSRDRFGIKPFFYHTDGMHIAFASEIKALLLLPWVKRHLSKSAVKDYLYFSRVDTSEKSFFEGILSLKPGHCFSFGLNKDDTFNIRQWWDIQEGIQEIPQDEEEIFAAFRDLLLEAVTLRLRSDVPVGTCLSGGLDSTSIVSLANPYIKEGYQRTFSIIQPGHPFDESPYIDRIVSHFKVESKKRTLSGADLKQDLTRVILSHDEPFTSTSMYAQWKVFELAKSSGVTVTLDGQGADETLAGYSYFKAVFWSELLKRFQLRRFIQEIYDDAGSFSRVWENLILALAGSFSHRKMITLARYKDPQYLTAWINKEYFKHIPLPHPPVENIFSSPLNQRLYEVFTFDGLPALLRYADRNSMIHSLESRMPFMDYKLVSFLFSLPAGLKIRNGFSKFVLRQALKEDVPDYILNRRDKIPFLTPEAQWFRDEMRDLMEDVFRSDTFCSRPFIQSEKVKRLFEKHVKNEIDASRPLWRILNLELWMREYIDR